MIKSTSKIGGVSLIYLLPRIGRVVLVLLTILLLVSSISGCKVVMDYHLDECRDETLIVDSSDTGNDALLKHGSGNNDGLYAQYAFDDDSYVVCANRWFRGEGYNADPNNDWYAARYYIEASDRDEISPLEATGEMTVAGWFKTGHSNGTIISKSGATINSREYRVFLEGGTLKVTFWDEYGSSKTFEIASSVADNGWHAFSVTAKISVSFFPGSNLQVEKYLDGDLKGTEISDDFVYCTNTSGPLFIGAMAWSNTNITDYFDGYIDELVMTDDVQSHNDLRSSYLNMKAHKDGEGSDRTCSCAILPLAEYRFDECTLTEGVIDSSGNGHNGTVQGDAENSLAAGDLCRGAEFDGVDDYIEVPSSNNLSSSTAMSFCAWVNTRVNDTKKIVHRGDWNAHQGLAQDKWNGWFVEFTINESNESLKWNEGSGSNRVPNQNQWYYLVGTYDGNDIKLYVDGQLEKSEHVPGTLSVKDTPLWIGSEGTKKIFDGFIDEVMVFDRALTATQIAEMYHNYTAGDSWDGESRDCLPCQGFCFFDDFDRASLGSNWTVLTPPVDPCNTYENSPPKIVDGLLQFTAAEKWKASGITLNGKFPAQNNYVEIEFNHYAYGGKGADGMVVVLSDADKIPIIGGNGGSMGYAASKRCKNISIPGFNGAWLGIALDEYGGFSKPKLGRPGGPGKTRDSVSIRGHGDGMTGYDYLAGTETLVPGIDNKKSTDPAPGYKYRISFDTRSAQSRIKVEREILKDDGFVDILEWLPIENGAVPNEFRLSFTAGTGGQTNYHSIDNLTINAINCGTIGDDGPDHFEFIHDGHGLTCAAETVTLKAWLDADETSPYVGDMEVTLPDLGWLTDTVQTLTFPASGEVSLSLKHTKAETVTLDVVSGDPATSPPVYCSGGNPNACDLIFADSGFLIAVANGRSCADLNGTIQAVQKDEETSFCVGDESFAGTTRDIGLWFNYSAPDSGGKNLYVNSTELGQTKTASTANLTFDENAAADFALNYADAGSLNLHARFEGSGVEAELEMTGSTTQPFIVAPDHFVVTSPLNNTTSGGSTTGIAAAPFSATITAVCYGGTVTPNFAADTFLTAEEPHQPSSGVLGGLGNGLLDLNTFSDGVSTPNNLTYSEVGNFTLQAESKEYLGSDMDISGSLVVGRFIPAHFELTQGTLINRIDSGCSPDSSFTYLDENLEFTYQLEAQNSAGAATKNYIANFAKFDGSGTQLSPVIYIGGAVAKDPDGISTNLTSRLDYHSAGQDSPWSDGAGSFRVKLNVNRLANPDGYFDDARFGVYVKDEDGVQIANPDLDVDGDLSMDYTQVAPATTLGYGRLHLQNAHGSELLDLAVPLQAEYWDGDAFVINPFDGCTSFTEADLALTSAKGNGSGNAPIEVNNGKTTTATINNQPLLLGDGSLEFSAPGTGGDGWVDVELTVPSYLQFDWHGTGDENPTSRATFGIYKGSENIIYLRETTWR